MNYTFSFENPNTRYIRIQAEGSTDGRDQLFLQLPAWRPGRYELGNFAKNVRNFKVYDHNGRELKASKVTKDKWLVDCKGASAISAVYEYYAADLNAGSTFLDATQLYVNPVNCCIYKEHAPDEACEVMLNVPHSWKVATAMEEKGKLHYTAPDFDRLADSPFIASENIQHSFFILDGVEFHLWFRGECKPDWAKITSDFFIFVNEQMQLFGSFPVPRFHFLFQILPVRFYHGVEHVDSTVIALGPSYKLMGDMYNDLLGVSSHELFHAWNIKTIRPAEMHPYDFTKENYSRQGFVAEGVTTYYGDYLLFRSGVWNEGEFWPELEDRMMKHFETHARSFLSVADASFDTWLDGYVPGAPHRKTSIYHEGCLLAFVTDMFIRRNSSGKHSLDNVMRVLWQDYAQKGKGYREEDYKMLVEHFAGADFSYYWNNYFFRANSYEPILQEALATIGCELRFVPSVKSHERLFGFRMSEGAGPVKVTDIYYNSPAENAGLASGDEILAVNGYRVNNDAGEWIRYFLNETIELTVNSNGEIRKITLQKGETTYYNIPHVFRNPDADETQALMWMKWSRKRF